MSRIKRFFSQYGPQFPATLASIAARSEGNAQKYLLSYRRTEDFFEEAKHVKANPQTRYYQLLVYAMIVPAWIVMALLLFVLRISVLSWVILAVIVCALAPTILAYGLAAAIKLLPKK